ncbi:MAG: hypothetical protein R3C09_19735 [Pirellulaceae bacterium]
MTEFSDAAWVDLILSDQDAEKVWRGVFDRLLTIAVASTRPTAIDKATIAPDRLLAESAWNCGKSFHIIRQLW